MSEVRTRVDQRLQRFFAQKSAEARDICPPASDMVDAIGRLTIRGGKRLRPAVLFTGFRAVCPTGDPDATVEASCALELLQSYLLIHDDWMDQDERRRNGPALHVEFRAKVGDRQTADSMAILAGDLACGFAWELLHNAPFPPTRRDEAFAEFSAMHQEVIFGQQLDLLGDADVALMHHLKTGSYTVRGPLRLGALLADASAAELDALSRFGSPLGLAFQLRDDLLGAFGDSLKTGKPVGSDLRAGKNTALVAEARALLGGEQLNALQQVLGNRQASDREIESAIQLLSTCGARQRVEERLEQLLQQARLALQDGPLSDQGSALLLQLVDMLAVRDR